MRLFATLISVLALSLGSSFAYAKFKVVTTFTIIQDMAQNIAGDAATVESITKPGAEIHDYEPTPKDIVKAQSADLVLWNGLNLERWFEKFFQNVKDKPAVVVTEGIEPMSINEGPYTGNPNPHAWMSPSNALIYIENIKNALVKYDPQNKETWPINAEQQGTPQQVRKVIETVKANNIPVVFSESTISPKPAKQVAKETGAKYGGVLYVDSLSNKKGPVPTYIDLLNTTVSTIAKGFEK